MFEIFQVVESLLGESGDLIQTGSPCILCTPLPNHWRSNKSLPSAFKVFTFQVRFINRSVSLTFLISNNSVYKSNVTLMIAFS